MKNEEVMKKERDEVLHAVQEIFEKDHCGAQQGMEKVVKAIAASGSYILQFLNLAYITVIDIQKDLDKNEKENAKIKLDRLGKEILDYRKEL